MSPGRRVVPVELTDDVLEALTSSGYSIEVTTGEHVVFFTATDQNRDFTAGGIVRRGPAVRSAGRDLWLRLSAFTAVM